MKTINPIPRSREKIQKVFDPLEGIDPKDIRKPDELYRKAMTVEELRANQKKYIKELYNTKQA